MIVKIYDRFQNARGICPRQEHGEVRLPPGFQFNIKDAKFLDRGQSGSSLYGSHRYVLSSAWRFIEYLPKDVKGLPFLS